MNEESIQPIAFQRSDSVKVAKKPKKIMPWILGLFLLLLIGLASFVMLAQQISLRFSPEPEALDIRGRFPVLRVGDSLLAWPGSYNLGARCEGYEALQRAIVVERKDEQSFEFEFNPLPGSIRIVVVPDVAAKVFNAGNVLGVAPGPYELLGGTYALRVEADDYVALHTNVLVEGLGRTQELTVALIPAWSVVHVESRPNGATVYVGDEVLGKAPLDVELFAGEYSLRFEKAGFEITNQVVDVKANTPVDVVQELLPAMGLFRFESVPEGVGVQIDSKYRGQTPLELKLKPGENHRILFLKPGYAPFEQSVIPSVGEERVVKADMVPLKGTLRLSSVPAGAEVVYEGGVVGVTPMELEVSCIEQMIEFRLSGYKRLQKKVHARSGPAQRVHVNLVAGAVTNVIAKGEVKEVAPIAVPSGSKITAVNGYVLTKIPAATYMMGSSRREQGRRANENRFEVELSRPVYFGVYEVTNEQFDKFDPAHTSGLYKNKRLHSANQPVSGVTWEQAVAYCNWMSKEEGLPLAYKKDGEEWFAITPLNTGYRLPTEAEWEFCARFDGKEATRKYPWGVSFPPTAAGGNLADAFARNVVSATLKGYSDGEAVSAAVGSYPPSALDIFDLSGNVSEWCHDSYQISVLPSDKVDPAGSGRGALHIIRGSSWKQSAVTQLRCASRDYGDEARVDLGFRVVRYAQ